MHVLKSWPWIWIQSTYLTECAQMLLNWDTVFCSLKRRRDTSFKVLNAKCHMQQHCDYLWNAKTCFVIFGTWCANSGVCVSFLMYSKHESMCGSFIHKVFFKIRWTFFFSGIIWYKIFHILLSQPQTYQAVRLPM